ncbi:type I-C CRISPR-associated protein Cas7/Csd2 [Azospirillum sp. Vi22]|uniref:type I-C CRISPR-associated protein Cas7/Csd2 n=1 Tax=Azospirillum baldaniorum TaxID=1064539 RepID=UPI00157BAAB3|nr:type I-C CRISPR-associated protein Cas7/Csd2 [Azospirillum baldaniorum]NUB05167.1 type I-C CRISPR-associated protein Cas7/Csd2 [Azospirillum baldaniorum]
MGIHESRIEFVYLFDVRNGNPNGDPDAGNMPRLDPETGHGLVTDVSLKRKIRNYVQLTQEGRQGYEIYVREKAILNDQHARAYEANGIELDKGKGKAKGEADARKVTQWMCDTFFDVRTFGAVMTTGVNCGQVRGPVQITFAESLHPIVPAELSVTRMAVTTQAEADKQSGDNRTMGRKHIVPYGLYRAHGFLSPHLARQTGFSDADLDILRSALVNMFEMDRSAARGEMAARRLIAFRHKSPLGEAPAQKLFKRVAVEMNDGVTAPRDFDRDFTVSIDRDGLPEGVDIEEWL